MEKIDDFDEVEYTGPFDPNLCLATGEVGFVLEDYGDGNFEVEFSLPDGSTWLQCAVSGKHLRKLVNSAKRVLSVPSRDELFPAILRYEAGDRPLTIKFSPTGEFLEIQRDAVTGRLTITTPLLGTITSISRPFRK